MFVNLEVLEQHNACKSGIKAFEEFYPNGVEIKTLLNDNKLQNSIIHWGFINLPVDEDEKLIYFKKFNIINSSKVYFSENVENSYGIVGSKMIRSSQYIERSKGVENSTNCKGSREVFGSDFVFKSKDVVFSQKVLNSAKIHFCNEIVGCKDLYECDNMDHCENMRFSFLDFGCKNSNYIGFSSNLENCNNCLFCSNLKDKSFYLFNQPVDKDYFHSIWKEFEELIKNLSLQSFLIKYDNTKSEEEGIEVDGEEMVFNNIYTKIPCKIYKFIISLPEYNALTMYNITFIPKFLKS